MDTSNAENRTAMIHAMERKLNPLWYSRRNKTDRDTYCTISIAQFWDWLTYIDDDYLTEFEVIKMKELYYQQLQELSGQFVAHTLVGWLATFPLMGPIVRSAAHGWLLRFPVTLTISLFLMVQASNWDRPNKIFHEIVAQPAPHGTYLRRSLREHFPVWWSITSAQLNTNGFSLPEMNEYDKAILMPKDHTKFNADKF